MNNPGQSVVIKLIRFFVALFNELFPFVKKNMHTEVYKRNYNLFEDASAKVVFLLYFTLTAYNFVYLKIVV